MTHPPSVGSDPAWGVGARWHFFGFTRALELQLGVLMGLFLLVLAAQAVFTLVLATVGTSGAEAPAGGSGWNPAWNRFHALMVALCVAPLPFLLDGSMDAERLWRRRAAPLGVWRRNRANLWSFAVVVVLVALLPLVALALMAPSPAGAWAHLGWTLTWFCAALGSGALFSLLWRGGSGGGVSRLWDGWRAAPATLLVMALWLMVMQALLDTGHWVAWLEGQGWRSWGRWVLMAAGCAGCGLWWVAREARDGLAEPDAPAIAAPRGWRARLETLSAYLYAQTRSMGPTGNVMVVVVGTQFNTWLQPLDNGQFKNFPTLGSELSYAALYMIMLMSLLASSLLAGVSLHWRDVLAPGRSRRLQWGWSVAAWTWARMVLLMLLWLAVLAGLKLLFPTFIGGRSSLSEWLGAAGSWLPVLLVDLALAACLTAALAPLHLRHRGLGPLVALAVMVGLVQLVLWQGFDVANPTLMQRDGTWLATVAAACAALLWAARRAWARVDLSELRRQQDRAEAEAGL